jgi:hypothetical protein
MFVVCCAIPPQNHRPRIHPRMIRQAKQHAKYLCYNYENTKECKNAWRMVEQLELQYKEQIIVDLMIREAMLDK